MSKKYVIIKNQSKTFNTPYDSSIYYTIEIRKKFLWFKWLKTYQEKGQKCKFETFTEASNKLKNIKK